MEQNIKDELSKEILDHILSIEEISKIENIFVHVYFDKCKHMSYNIKTEIKKEDM